MLMILGHHATLYDRELVNHAVSAKRLIFQFCFESTGKIGVIIFFAISAWYFADTNQSLKQCFKRVWILERELLFWSILFAMYFFIFQRQYISTPDFIRSFAPLSMSIWWYPTAYAIFLVTLPFFQIGLQKLGRNRHLILCIISLVIFGLIAFFSRRFELQELWGFYYLYLLMTAYKWYLKPFPTRTLLLFLGVGILCIIPFIGLSLLPRFAHSNFSLKATGSYQLPAVLIGLSLFLLFERKVFHNFIINTVAKSAFAVYLITMYPAAKAFLWSNLFYLERYYDSRFAVLILIAIMIVVYTVCTLLDFIRQFIFRLTVDRHKGKWFEAFYVFITSRYDHSSLQQRAQALLKE